MLLTCPNCGTQYVVKDGAIPSQGRQVRCASCKHSWHQDPDREHGADEVATAPIPPPIDHQPEVSGEPERESFAEAAFIEPRSGPEAEEQAYEAAMAADAPPSEVTAPSVEEDSALPADDRHEAPAYGEPPPPTSYEAMPEPAERDPAPVVPNYEPAPASEPVELQQQAGPTESAPDWREPPQGEAQDDEFSPFAARDDELKPRRRNPVLTLLLIALLVGGIAAAFWFLAPAEWKARIGLADSRTSPLALITTHMDRQKLESGNELLTVTGRVINPTSEDQPVPPLQAQLKSRGGQVVYSWTIAPPARSLPPGASASFNSAEVNVPPGGDELTISLGAPKA